MDDINYLIERSTAKTIDKFLNKLCTYLEGYTHNDDSIEICCVPDSDGEFTIALSIEKDERHFSIKVQNSSVRSDYQIFVCEYDGFCSDIPIFVFDNGCDSFFQHWDFVEELIKHEII